MDNFVTAKTYRLAAWTKPLPQPAQRELRLAFPKGQRQPLVRPSYHPRRQREPAAAAWQATAPYQARHGDQRMFPRTPMTAGRVPDTETSPVAALRGEGWPGRVLGHLPVGGVD